MDLYTQFRPENDTETYRILIDWPHSDNDIAFQGATGNLALHVVATQVDEDEVDGPPYYAEEVTFKVTPNGKTRTATNKEINFYYNDESFCIIEVFMGDDAIGDFEENIGDLYIYEEVVGNNRYFKDISQYEYFASKTQI